MKVKYPSVDDLANIIRHKSKLEKVRIMKRDLRRSYQQLFSLLETIHMLGYTFKGLMYFDVTLSMGSTSEEVFDCLGYILDTIGIHESENRACAPMFIAVFLGILFKTLNMMMTIVPE